MKNLLVILTIALLVAPARAQVAGGTGALFEEAAKAREEAAVIWENLGDRVRAAQTWGEAAEAWEKSASAYEKAGDKTRAAEAWNRFRDAIAKRDRAEIRLNIVSGGGQTVQVGTPSAPLVVRLADNTGRPVAGVQVAFDMASQPAGGGAEILRPLVETDSSGTAQTRVRLGRKIGVYSISAGLPRLAVDPVAFDIKGGPGPAAKLEIVSGNNQVLKVNQRAIAPLVVLVSDIHGNPIPNVPVDFRIVGEPQGATGQSLSAEEAITDEYGKAGVRFQAGHLGGSYIVLIESGDLEGSPSKFELVVRQTIPTVRIIGLEIRGVTDTAAAAAGTLIGIDQTYLLPELGRAFRSEIERLYALGRFSDVRGSIDTIDDERAIAVFTLVERPLVAEIAIEGEKEAKEEELRSRLGVASGAPYSPAMVERSRAALREYLEDEGFLNATVSVETSVVSGKGKEPQINLTFRINENDKVKIHRMTFDGNRFFSDASLNWHMKTGQGKVYKEAEFQEDRQKILGRYYEKGFLSAEMHDPEITFDRDGRMLVRVAIDEGPQYRIGEIEFVGNTALTEKQLREFLKQESGEVFKASKFFSSIEEMRLATARRGYAEARVVPQEKLNFADAIVNFTIRVQEGRILYLENIVVEGNFKTQERVIVREVHMATGDVLDGDEIEKARKRLERLGFFEPGSVRMILREGSAPDQRELVVKVSEGRTGQVQFGAAYSGGDGFVGFASIEKKNFDPFDFWSFTGAGQELTLSTEYGGQKNSFNVSWTEPYFRNRPISIGFDGYNIFQEREGFDWRRRGGAGRLSHKWGEFGRMAYKYEYEEIDVFNVTSLAPLEVQLEAKFPPATRVLRTTSSVTTAFTHDNRDDINFPTEGHFLELKNELAGTFLGGNVAFTRPTFGFNKYLTMPWNKKHVLAFRGQYGTISNFFDKANPIPSVEKFYLGGASTVRGYSERSIQIFSNDRRSVVGPGEAFTLANLEYRVPFTDDKSISAAGFLDAGGVFSGEFDFAPEEIVYGVGAGVRMSTPLGLIRLDYGFGLNFPSDGRGVFHFAIGQTF